MRTVLGIDQSTSATKAVLFDENGALLDRASLDHRQIYPRPGWVEHDAEEIWGHVRSLLESTAVRHPARVAEAACLSITNQRETVVVFDRDTGRPLHHAIVWQCRRGDAICRQLTDSGHREEVHRKTGLKIDTYFSASKLRWLIENVDGLGPRLEGGEALIGTIDSYLIYRLTGGRVHATDPTNASRTLLFDIERLCWDEDLCAMFGVPPSALPEVRESAASFGEVSVEGLPPLPIRGVMGDSQASLFAQRCFQPGMAKVTFGTGSSILCNVGETLPEPGDSGIVTALGWVYQGHPVYALEGLINYAAATVSWLVDQLGLLESAEESEEIATAVPDNGGVYLVPAFSGLGAPYWDPSARAAIVGMTAHSGRSHVVRAALESIAYQVGDVLDAIEKEAGTPVRNLHADGGPTRNDFLMQFTADVTGAELAVSQVAESSALGAAMMGMLGSGVHASLEALAELPRESREFVPGLEAPELDRLWAGWKQAVAQVMHRA